MLSRIAQQAVKRALPIMQRPVLVTSFASFSTYTPGVGKGKTSTGIVGLAYDPDAVSKMVIHYQALLDRMAVSDMPETAQYRMDTEKIARYRIQMAMDHPEDPDMVEDLCQCGQVEELVEQAKDEMIVLDMYLQTRMWELVADHPEVEVEYNPDPANDDEGLDEEDLGK